MQMLVGALSKSNYDLLRDGTVGVLLRMRIFVTSGTEDLYRSDRYFFHRDIGLHDLDTTT